jgi:DNA-binding NtrC family response regulator
MSRGLEQECRIVMGGNKVVAVNFSLFNEASLTRTVGRKQDSPFEQNHAVENVMKRILIVDDEEAIRMFYAVELAEEGYEVITCGEGSRILDLVAQSSPDVVILDIKMGEHNGLDLLQDIRKDHYDLPVILCSAYSVFKYDIKSIAADYYVVKSADLRDLKGKVQMAIEGGMIQHSVKPRSVAYS